MDDKNKDNEEYYILRIERLEREMRLEKKKTEQEKMREYNRLQGLSENPEQKKQHFDSVYTLENSEATILYIIVMVIGTLFYDRVLIWIVATLIFVLFLTRHSRKK